MTGFSAQWLALREPYDLQARNPAVLDAVAAAFADRNSIGIADLACGTGSTMRAVSSRLVCLQDWRLVDNDLGLLAQATRYVPPRARNATTMPVDLARDVEIALDGPLDLVTTSALLDLVSEEWLERFVVEAAARHLPVYAALSYDGRATMTPADPLDQDIVAALNRHQRGEKGFGAALGPDAGDRAIARFKSVGYDVIDGPSDWVFAVRDIPVQEAMIAGWAQAARETGSLPASDIDSWVARRQAEIAAGRSSMRVGHVDFFARPIARR